VTVLLYDGLCGFCDRTVQFILAHDRKGTIRFAPLQGDFAREVFARHPEVRDVDSLILVETDAGTGHECVSVRSDGALRTASRLGGVWRAAAVLRIVPRPIRDAFYDAFAKVRYRVFGRLDECPLPSAEHRSRFLA
jgi:predicted DCC family thiol-disulfide oxidoreductase YuxK